MFGMYVALKYHKHAFSVISFGVSGTAAETFRKKLN